MSLQVLLLLSFTYLNHFANSLVRTLEVSPRVEANHDTFLYLCSLDVNEQNIGVLAYRNYQKTYSQKTWLRGVLPFTKSLDESSGSFDGREQPTFWTSTKGCTYRSDFNAGDEEGPYTNYYTGVQFEIALRTEFNEELFFKVFRSLPEWDIETDLGTTIYWVFEAVHVNNNSVDLLDAACDKDAEMVDCRRSRSFPTWNDTIPAYYPG